MAGIPMILAEDAGIDALESLNPFKVITDKTADLANKTAGDVLHHIPVIGEILDGVNWVEKKVGEGVRGAEQWAEEGIEDITGDHDLFEPVKKEIGLTEDQKISSGQINEYLKNKGYDVAKHKELNNCFSTLPSYKMYSLLLP